MSEISVIIPTFQPGEYLFDCIKSLEIQTLDKKRFEVIIILNGAKEPFFARITEYISNSELDFKLYYSESPGVSNARNIGLNHVESTYIAFVDDDDVVSKGYLERLLIVAEKDSIVISNSKTFKEDIHQTGNDYISVTYDKFINTKSISLLNGRRFFSNSCGKLIPLSIIGKTRFDNRISKGEDSVFMMEISRNISKVLISSHEAIYYIRLRSGSATRKKRKLSEITCTKYYELKKYFSFLLKIPPSYNLFFVGIMIATSLKSFIEDIYSSVRFSIVIRRN